MIQRKYTLRIEYDPDEPGGPTHQSSVQPGSAHLPVRGQPTVVIGSEGQVLPPQPPHCLIVEVPPPQAPPGPWMLRRFLL